MDPWIAQMDSAADDTALDEVSVSELITVVLIADLFDMHPEKVAWDVIRYRVKHFGHIYRKRVDARIN